MFANICTHTDVLCAVVCVCVVCMRVCVRACVRVCICVCVRVYVYVRVHVGLTSSFSEGIGSKTPGKSDEGPCPSTVHTYEFIDARILINGAIVGVCLIGGQCPRCLDCVAHLFAVYFAMRVAVGDAVCVAMRVAVGAAVCVAMS